MCSTCVACMLNWLASTWLLSVYSVALIICTFSGNYHKLYQIPLSLSLPPSLSSSPSLSVGISSMVTGRMTHMTNILSWSTQRRKPSPGGATWWSKRKREIWWWSMVLYYRVSFTPLSSLINTDDWPRTTSSLRGDRSANSVTVTLESSLTMWATSWF